MNIPFSPPDIGEEEIKEVIDTLKSGWITTGPKTKLFENKIADFCQTSRAVALNSATACMETTLRLLGVGPGDEVITSAYTYTATASVVCHVGARLVLVDTGTESFQMDYDKLEAAVTERTKVIIPVELGGVVCDYDRLFQIVESKKDLFRPSNDIQKKNWPGHPYGGCRPCFWSDAPGENVRRNCRFYLLFFSCGKEPDDSGRRCGDLERYSGDGQ